VTAKAARSRARVIGDGLAIEFDLDETQVIVEKVGQRDGFYDA
jgi:hypothetical protein